MTELQPPQGDQNRLKYDESTSSCPEEGMCDAKLYDELSLYVATPRFLQAFEGSPPRHYDRIQHSTLHPPPFPSSEGQHISQDHSTSTTCSTSSSSVPEVMPGSSQPSADPEPYVLVQQSDAVEAMAYYLAQCVTAHPEAQKLPPAQIQAAIHQTMQGLKQTRFKQMCTYGRTAYRWTALTYSALQMYQNPWLIRAVITTIWAFSKLGMRAFV